MRLINHLTVALFAIADIVRELGTSLFEAAKTFGGWLARTQWRYILFILIAYLLLDVLLHTYPVIYRPYDLQAPHLLPYYYADWYDYFKWPKFIYTIISITVITYFFVLIFPVLKFFLSVLETIAGRIFGRFFGA